MNTPTPLPLPSLILNDFALIPQVGFGVYKVDPQDTYRVVSEALEVGYRHIDTAALYGNEAEVGQAIRESGIPRQDIFVTTKLWNTSHGRQEAKDAFSRSLEALDLDYVDLYLIHWPQPAVNKYVETWESLIELQQGPELTSIGVSNFTEPTLERIISETGVVPVLNQIEAHLGFSQEDMREVHCRWGVRTESWSPLARGQYLDGEVVQTLAAAHERTAAQIVLRWHMQLGNIVIPKTTHRARMVENLAIVDFALSDDEMAALTKLDRPDGRMSKHPDEFNGDL